MTSQEVRAESARENTDSKSVEKLIAGIWDSPIPPARPEYEAIDQNVINCPVRPLREGASLKETKSFVLKGTGITASSFNAKSPKPLESLHAERGREVNLALDLSGGKTRRIIRFSSNAVGMVFDSRNWLALHEVGRKVLESGAVVTHDEPKPHGCRETALRRQRVREGVFVEEPPTTTMIRGFLEEPGIMVFQKDLIPLTPARPEPSDHPSTMYLSPARYRDGTPKLLIRSIVMSYWFGVDIAELGLDSLEDWDVACGNVRRDGNLFLVEDEGVQLRFQILPLAESQKVRLLKALVAQRNQLM